jgi:hypothetical protein
MVHYIEIALIPLDCFLTPSLDHLIFYFLFVVFLDLSPIFENMESQERVLGDFAYLFFLYNMAHFLRKLYF